MLAPAHPADVGRARLRVPEGHARSRSSSSSPKNAQYYAALGAVLYGLHEEDGRRRPRRGARRPARVHDERAQGAPRRDRPGRRSSKTESELDEFRELYAIPKFVPATFDDGPDGARRHRPRRRLDLVARRCSSTTRTARSSARPTSSRRATRSRTRRSSSRSSATYVEDDQGAKLEVMGFGATGYAADVLEECVRADVNIVETVAHMMSAVHFFGDVDVICDIGGQDIKVLFMKNGDIANFRLSNSCSAGNGMLLQATADSFGVPVTEFADVAFKAELAPKFSLRLRRLPRHRPRELPEGGLLEGGDARRPRAGAAEERLAVRRADPAPRGARDEVRPAGRHAVQPRRGQGAGRLHQGARARRRGLRPPAHGRGRRDRRGDGDPARREAQGQVDASSASMRRSTSSTRRKNDEETVCHFCPNKCKRTFIDTKRPDGIDEPLHRRLLLREGHRRVEGGDARRSSPSGRRSRSSSRTCVDVRGEARRSMHFYDAGADARGRRADRRRRGAEGHLRHAPRRRSRARSSARRKESWEARRRVRIGIPRVLNMYSTGAVVPDVLRGARHPEAERRLQRRDDRGDVGRGRQVRVDRPLLPVEGRAGAHPQPALRAAHRRRSRSSTSSSRSSRT